MNGHSRFNRRNAGRLLNAIGPVFGLALVIGLFSLSPAVRTHFFTGINCKIILLQTVIVAIGALGMTMIIVSGGIDLSVGSVVALASVVGAFFRRRIQRHPGRVIGVYVMMWIVIYAVYYARLPK